MGADKRGLANQETGKTVVVIRTKAGAIVTKTAAVKMARSNPLNHSRKHISVKSGAMIAVTTAGAAANKTV